MGRGPSIITIAFAISLACGCGDDGRQQDFDGPWARHTVDDTLRGADGVRVDDINGDGLPDVAAGWENDGVTRVYLHPGHASVRDPWPAVTVAVTHNVEDAVFADVDDDGRIDVVSSSEGATQRITVSFAPADPDDLLDPSAWTSEVIPASEGRRWMYAVPLDVDGRNGIDLVVGGKRTDAIVGWLESPADPRDLAAWTLHEIAEAGWIMSIDAVDLDGDGVRDLLVSDRSSSINKGVYWYRHPLDVDEQRLPWPKTYVGSRGRSPVFLAPVFDPAGRVDGIVVPSGGENLTLFQREDEAAATWREQTIRIGHPIGTPKSAAVGDIDLDGIDDVVLAATNLDGHDDGIVWLSHAAVPLGAGEEGPLRYSISGAQGQKFDRVELLDLDGDGDLDVLTTEEISGFGVLWYENPLR